MLANYGFKLRYIFLPLVLFSTAFLVVFGLLYWLVVLRLGWLELNSETQFWGFFVLGGLGSYAVLRKPLRLLRRGSDDRWVMLFYLVPTFMLLFGAQFSADYLTQTTGQLASLQTPEQALRQPAARFYTVERAYVHKNGLGVYTTFTPKGKHNENISVDFYVVCPLLAVPADTARPQPTLWVGWHQSEVMDASLPPAKKQELYAQFARHCEDLYRTADLSRFEYLARATAADNKAEFQAAARKSAFLPGKAEPVVVILKTSPFATRAEAPLRHLRLTLLLGLGGYLLLLMFPGVDTMEALKRISPQPDDVEPSLWQELKPYVWLRPGYRLTPLLVAANAGVYLAMVGAGLGVMAFRSADLMQWGALLGPLVVEQGEWWRLLSSAFLHGGLMHIVYNLVALGLVSWLLEPVLGAWRLALVFVLTALGASLVNLWWAPEAVSVGASGAIFGLFGAATALAFSHRVPEEDRGILLLISLLYGGSSLLMGFFTPGTGNAAHLGGLASGLLCGVLLGPTLPDRGEQRIRRSRGLKRRRRRANAGTAAAEPK